MTFGKRAVVLSGVLASVMSASVVQAEEPSFGFFEFGHFRLDLDDVDENPDGVAFNANFDVAEHVFIRAGFATVESDFQNGFVEGEEKRIGVGYKLGILDSMSFYVAGDVVRAEAKADPKNNVDAPASESDTGYMAETGIRTAFTSWFQLDGFVQQIDVLDDDDTTYGIGAIFTFAESLGASVNITSNSDSDITTFVGIRASF